MRLNELRKINALTVVAAILLAVTAVNLVTTQNHALAQEGTVVSESDGRPYSPHANLIYYNGSNLIEYRCYARAFQAPNSWIQALGSLTNVVVASNVGTVNFASAHGLAVDYDLSIQGSALAALNAAYRIASVPTATSVTVTTSGVADATYTTGLRVTSSGPRTNAPVWTVEKYYYSGSLLTRKAWSSPNVRCADKGTIAYN